MGGLLFAGSSCVLLGGSALNYQRPRQMDGDPYGAGGSGLAPPSWRRAAHRKLHDSVPEQAEEADDDCVSGGGSAGGRPASRRSAAGARVDELVAQSDGEQGYESDFVV